MLYTIENKQKQFNIIWRKTILKNFLYNCIVIMFLSYLPSNLTIQNSNQYQNQP